MLIQQPIQYFANTFGCSLMLREAHLHLDFAVGQRRINQVSHFLTGLGIGKGDREDPDPFTLTEIEIILSTPTKRVQELHMMVFSFWSGLRISELIALAWEDIDLKRGTVKVCRAKVNGTYKQTETKRSSREVELIKSAIEWLKAQRPLTEVLPPRKLKVMSRDNKKTFSRRSASSLQ